MLSKGNLGHKKRSVLLIISAAVYCLLPLLSTAQTVNGTQIALSQPLTLKWSYQSDSTINLTPAIDKDRVYLPLASGQLVSLDATSGQLHWKTDLGGELSSSPLADDRAVYVASETSGAQDDGHRANGVLRALGREGGITLWMRAFPMPLRGSLIGNSTNIFGGSSDGRVYAVRKKTGDIAWVMQHTAPFASHPTIYGANIFIGSSDGSVFSLNQANGKINWRYRTQGAIQGRAVVFNGIVFVGSTDGFVYALREADGQLRWRRRTGAGVQTVATVPQGLIVASFDNFVYLLSYRNGDRLWKRQLAGRIAAEPLTAHDGALFTPLASTTAVVLNLRDGKQLNSIPMDEENSLSASPVLAGQILLVTTRHGLLAFSRPG
jgi:eukaryotic-like serine/threonine-protein kinase